MCGGGVAADQGYFIQPTIFGDVQDDMTIAREEVRPKLIASYPIVPLHHDLTDTKYLQCATLFELSMTLCFLFIRSLAQLCKF